DSAEQTFVYTVREAKPVPIFAPTVGGGPLFNQDQKLTFLQGTIQCYRTDKIDPTCTGGVGPAACGTDSVLVPGGGAPLTKNDTHFRVAACSPHHSQADVLHCSY